MIIVTCNTKFPALEGDEQKEPVMEATVKTVSLTQDDHFAVRHVLLMRRLELQRLLSAIAESFECYSDLPIADIYRGELEKVERLLSGNFRIF